MFSTMYHLAFIGPGGPEFLVVMLVLLLMFGAKDAPRMLRKLNEIINSVRNTADGFKREILYSDLDSETESAPAYDDGYEEPDYDLDDEYCSEANDEEELEREYSDETFQNLEEDLEQEVDDESTDEEDDARKA